MGDTRLERHGPGPSHLGGPFAAWLYSVATFLVLLPSIAVWVSSLGFLAGITLTPWHLPTAVLVTTLAAWSIARAEGITRFGFLLAMVSGLAVFAVAAVLGHALLDFSYDGQAYHQSAVRQLASGWNPFAHALTVLETIHGLWLNHYVRAAELGAAVVVSATGSLESGKAFAIELLVPAIVFGALALRCAGVSRLPAWLAAIAGAANPVTVAQLPTFYVDGQLGLLFSCSLSLAWLSLRDKARAAPFLFVATLALLANVKFTGTVYAALILAGYVAATIWQGTHRQRRELAPLVFLALLGTLAIGWQPLVTNASTRGHPFYPVAGASRVDGQSGQTPYFRHRYAIGRLWESTFSESRSGRVVPTPKLPFVIRESELVAMGVPDVRVGGFGPLFALGLVLTMLGVAALPWSAPAATTRIALLVSIAVMATALVNPIAWWARFVPQLWIAVVIAIVALWASGGVSRALGITALAALLADVALVSSSAMHHELDTERAASRQARELAERLSVVLLPRGEMEALDLRLARFGVRASYVPSCRPVAPLLGTYADYCEAVSLGGARVHSDPEAVERSGSLETR